MKMNKNCLSIAVIGGGASGMIAAVFAARQALERNLNYDIRIYDSNSRIGKKILVTGNGRCNFTNENISEENFHGEASLAISIYDRFNNKMTKDFFHSVGLLSKSDPAGRVYPMSSQASALLDCLRYEIKRLGIYEITETKIIKIEKFKNGFLLNGEFLVDKCILATGGKAAPVHGSDGSGFLLLDQLGIKYSRLFPGLTPLVCSNYPKSLKGIRANGKITLKSGGSVLAEDSGEIQYTDFGLSGIVSMQVSRYAADFINKNKEVIAVVDSCPSMSVSELKDEILYLIKNNTELPAEMLLAGILPKKLGVSFLADCSINPSMEIGKLHNSVIDKIINVIKSKKYKISSVKGFNDAQITCGGVSSNEINVATMELLKFPGLFVCGEIVNVDGDCGGYNLQWAWSSGAVAGISAAGGRIV